LDLKLAINIFVFSGVRVTQACLQYCQKVFKVDFPRSICGCKVIASKEIAFALKQFETNRVIFVENEKKQTIRDATALRKRPRATCKFRRRKNACIDATNKKLGRPSKQQTPTDTSSTNEDPGGQK
jgi:hypothetical protein